jgi:hypothetical protein
MLTVVIAGCIVVLACWSMLMWMSTKMRNEFQREFGALSGVIRTLEQEAAGHAKAAETSLPADITKIEIVAAQPTKPTAARPFTDQESTAISPETHVAIKAALSSFLGHDIRIRSVELLETPDVATAWATQGRIAVQTSHDQRTNRG